MLSATHHAPLVRTMPGHSTRKVMIKCLLKTFTALCLLGSTACQTTVHPNQQQRSKISPLARDASTAAKPRKIPEDLLSFAFDQDVPDSRFVTFDGGPGSNVDGSYHNYRRVGDHNLTMGYDNRELKIDFTHQNGKALSFEIGSYWWPTSGNSRTVSVAIFRSPGDEILLAVGGVPAAIIYPAEMRARVIGYQGTDKAKILTPESLGVFAKVLSSTSQSEQ